jgi:serine/threonine protein kinase/tetratricopeptide (TPR) repeat protein
MGEVYLADDLALGRPTALKILPEGFSPELRVRLFREAEASARLQHPGIATFYEAGESDGVAFLAMEYVAGETLRLRLAAGSLGFAEALSMIAGILEALAHAHAVGILHRDIKPENVMLTEEGAAKLLDFGLAKRLAGDTVDAESQTDIALTLGGATVGTLGYMSPEQLRGDPLDARSDVFAVGAVLYEAISGERAFPGRTAGERITAILSRDPPAVSRAGTPPELHALLSKALARDADRRYPSASAFLSDLRRVGSGEFVSTMPDTLALLDFENVSGNADDNWIGSGIAESVAVDLGRVSGLTVLSRERVLKARAASRSESGVVDPRDVGLALGCRWLLSGGYQRAGSALRVTARLIEIATGRVVWTEKLDGDLETIFQIQDRLSAAAVGSLNLTVKTPEPGMPSGPDLDAYECYARGRRLYFRLEKGSFDQARELYQQAVTIDPGYAPALAGMAAVHALRFTFTTDTRDLDASIEFARRSIGKDPTIADAYVWLGYSLMRQGLMEAALEAQATGMELDPGHVFAPYFIGCVHAFCKRYTMGLPFFQRALEIDPNHGWSWLGLGWSHLELGHPAEARWSLERAAKLERERPEGPTAGVSGYLGECLRRAGDFEGARAGCLDGLDAIEKSDHMYRDTFRAVCLCVLGRTALQQEDLTAARAAFRQASSQLRGRPRALGGGQLLVQALSGLVRAGESADVFEEGRGLFENRHGFNFSLMWLCTDDVSLLELSRAAAVLGRAAEAQRLLDRAREAGSTEAGGNAAV